MISALSAYITTNYAANDPLSEAPPTVHSGMFGLNAADEGIAVLERGGGNNEPANVPSQFSITMQVITKSYDVNKASRWAKTIHKLLNRRTHWEMSPVVSGEESYHVNICLATAPPQVSYFDEVKGLVVYSTTYTFAVERL